MLNRENRFFRLLFLFLCGCIISISFSSCEKEKETIGIIVVKDFNNNAVPGAYVTLHQDGLISDQGAYTNPELRRTETTDGSGRAQFIYELEAIFNVEVWAAIGNDTLTGNNVIRLLEGKTETQTVQIN